MPPAAGAGLRLDGLFRPPCDCSAAERPHPQRPYADTAYAVERRGPAPWQVEFQVATDVSRAWTALIRDISRYAESACSIA